MEKKTKLRLGISLIVFLILFTVFSLLSERRNVSDSEGDSLLLERTLRITNGVTHSVPLNSIISGGPPKDGIPSIDRPKFVSIEKANEYINDGGLGISVSVNDTHRFYPNQILVWHEIVNDVIDGQPVLVTYCPLCATGIVFDATVQGEATEFGTSGKLWNSNLVMYDRRTSSYWSQVLGEAIVGEMTGTALELLPHDNLLYADWKKLHPDGEVLSRDTSFIRNYKVDPYGGYYSSPSVFFRLDYESELFHPKEITYGIRINESFKAYTLVELQKGEADFEDELAQVPLRVSFDKELRIIDIRRTDNDSEIIPTFGFWFSWFSVHPDTEVYRADNL